MATSLRPAAAKAAALLPQTGYRAAQQPAAVISNRAWPRAAPWARSLHASPVATRSSSGGGPITSDLIASMRQKIGTALETELVEVQDMQGDGRHVEIVVVSKVFEGKSAVARQRLVYKVSLGMCQQGHYVIGACKGISERTRQRESDTPTYARVWRVWQAQRAFC
jgi:acid stress-induced BolA-like protein IbaG/YrbA